MRRILYLIIVSIGILTASAFAQSADDLFKQGNDFYLKQNYNQAIEKYESILNSGTTSFEVYFNLGNAYYKTGNYTKAILNYERAKKLKPDDNDVDLNLALANQNTIDKIEPAPKVFYEEWWENYLTYSSTTTRAIIFLIIFWLSVISFGLYIFFKVYSVKKTFFFLSFLLLGISLFYFYVTYQQNRLNENSNSALIISQSAYIKSSPDDKGTNLFQLHEGTKINITDELQGWKKIKIPNGNEGWIRDKDIEKI
ncbi:MAG: tetratricopeptide repeat protein [Bacteroidetes bacterium]|jgi:tetratricopeptide (TPR) repeat protein|nr:tetratricopeptide repeat protein [Bacteroidota bacterium]